MNVEAGLRGICLLTTAAALLSQVAAAAGPPLELVERYHQCLSTLAWATPLAGDRMARHDVFQKKTVAGQPVYFLARSDFPAPLTGKSYVFGPGGAVSVELGEVPRDKTDSRYLPQDHHYLNLKVPGVPVPLVGDLASMVAYGGVDTFLTLLDRDSTEGRDFIAKHPLASTATEAEAAPESQAVKAMKAETLAALEVIGNTPLGSIEKGKPGEYKNKPERKNIFDRFKEALSKCSQLSDPEIQAAITDGQTKVAAEYAAYLQKYPAKTESTFDLICRKLGLTD